jgi:excisionase family DNA binding protein
VASQLRLPLVGWMTPDEASRLLDVTPAHVRDLCRRGVLTARLDRRQWLVDEGSVRAYLHNRVLGHRVEVRR